MDNTLKQLSNLYPDITWSLIEPSVDIMNAFGNGTVMRGEKDGEIKEFFVLEKDKRKLQWGHVIANYLNKTVDEDVDVQP